MLTATTTCHGWKIIEGSVCMIKCNAAIIKYIDDRKPDIAPLFCFQLYQAFSILEDLLKNASYFAEYILMLCRYMNALLISLVKMDV